MAQPWLWGAGVALNLHSVGEESGAEEVGASWAALPPRSWFQLKLPNFPGQCHTPPSLHTSSGPCFTCHILPGDSLSSRFNCCLRKSCINVGSVSLFCFSILKQVCLFFLKYIYEFVWTVLPKENLLQKEKQE